MTTVALSAPVSAINFGPDSCFPLQHSRKSAPLCNALQPVQRRDMAWTGGLPYSAGMTDSSAPDALARRYLDLWEEQMAAWASDAALADVLRLWLGLVGLDRFGAGSGGDGASGRGGTDGERA